MPIQLGGGGGQYDSYMVFWGGTIKAELIRVGCQGFCLDLVCFRVHRFCSFPDAA